MAIAGRSIEIIERRGCVPLSGGNIFRLAAFFQPAGQISSSASNEASMFTDEMYPPPRSRWPRAFITEDDGPQVLSSGVLLNKSAQRDLPSEVCFMDSSVNS
jgi:hypothetical protein